MPITVPARGRVLRHPGDAEVGQLDAALGAEQDVRRADVTVDQAEVLAVRPAHAVDVVERVRHATDRMDRGAIRQRLALLGGERDQLAQREPAHVLHDQEVRAVVLAEVEHLHDVLVIEPHADERLAQQVADAVGVVADLLAQDLDRDQLLEPRCPARAGEIDLAHPTEPEQPQEVIPPELSPREFHSSHDDSTGRLGASRLRPPVVARQGSATAPGTRLEVAAPSPSWPRSPRPQQWTRPSPCRAQVWS